MTTDADQPDEIETPKPVIPEDDDSYSDDDMSLLTDEERAALVDDAGEDDDEDEPEADAEGDADADEDDEDSTPADPAPAADVAAVDDADEPEPARRADPLPDTAPLNDRLAAIEKERDALVEQFEDGDLTRDAYKAKLAEFATEERRIAADLAKVQARQEAVAEQFYGEVRAYAKEYPALLAADGPHIEAFDRHVRAVTASADYEHLSYRDMLRAAHALYEAESRVLKRDFVPMEKAPTPEEKARWQAEAAKAKAEAPKPKAPKPEIPPTLAKAPAAAAVAVSENRFAAIQQRIDAAQTAAEVEAIMASMSPAEQEAFASMDA
jgi:hypothetical protein